MDVFHYCDKRFVESIIIILYSTLISYRCDNCGYVCTLPQGMRLIFVLLMCKGGNDVYNKIGHPQPEHSTNHGSMSRTRWAVEGHNESIEVDSHKFGSNDDGAPMLCNLMCSNLGRHVHIDYCRSTKANGCNDAEIMHVRTRMEPNPEREKDWVTHNLYWRRLGFKGMVLYSNIT